MRKKLFAVLFIISVLFSSCTKQSYRIDFSAEELSKSCAEALAMQDFAFEGAAALQSEDLPGCDPDLSVCYSTDAGNLNEFGIWKATGEKPRQVAVFLSNLLLERYQNNESFYQTYLPEELPKLRDAEVRVYGNYIVYAVLSADDKKALFQFVEKALTKEKPAE